eukprot:1140882-Alexandrium_andersonii.AAC.1
MSASWPREATPLCRLQPRRGRQGSRQAPAVLLHARMVRALRWGLPPPPAACRGPRLALPAAPMDPRLAPPA